MAVGSNVDNKESTGICRSNQQSIITISSFQENSFGLPYQDHNYGAPPPPTPPLSPKLDNLQPNGIVLNKTPLKSIVSSNLRPELTSTTLMPPLVNGYRRSPVKISTSPVILKTPLEGALECICGEPNGRPEIVELKTMHDKVPNSENEADEDEDTSTNPSSVRVMYTSVQSTPTSLTITTNKNNNKKPPNECSLAGKKRKRSRDDTKKNGKRIYNYQIQLSSWEKKLIDWRESYQEIDENQYSEKLLQAVLALGLSQPDSLSPDGASKLIQLRQQLAKVQQLRHKLMSMEEIGVSQPVAEVKGIYITTEELQLSEEEICVKQYPHVFWYHSGGISGQLDMCVDARASGNNARFIRKSCCSNCEIRHIFEKDRLHLFVYAKKSISNGEEITLPFDYKYDESDFVVDCACTSPDNCLVYKDNLTKQDAGSNHIATAAVNPVVAREIEEDSSQQQRRISPLILTISRVHQECNGDVSPNPSTGTGTDNEAEEPNNGEHRRKKSREDRKLEAYIKAFERLEQKEKKKELGGGNHATTDDKQQQYNSRRPSRDNQQETTVEQQQSAHADNTTTYVVLANDQLTKSEQDSISETSSKDTSTLVTNAGAKRSTRKKGGRAARKGSRKCRTVSVEETSSTADPIIAAVKTEPLSERSPVGTDQNDLQHPAAAVAPHTLDDSELSLQAEKHPDEADGRINHVKQEDVSLPDTIMETAANTCESTAVPDHQDGCITSQHELLPPSSNHTVPPPNETEDVYIGQQITTLDGGGGAVETDTTDHCRTVKSDAAAFCSKPGSEMSSNHVASSKTQEFGCGQQHHDGQTSTTQSSIENSLLQMTFQPWEFTPGVPCRRVRIKSVRRHRRTYANTNCTSLKKLWLKNADEIETSAPVHLPEDAAPVSEVRSFKKRFLKQYSDSQTTLQTVNIETEPPPPPLTENHENSSTDAIDDETSLGLNSEWNNNDSSSEVTGLVDPNRAWRLGGTSAYSPYETATNNTTPITTDASDADHIKEVAKEEILEAETDAALSTADNDDVDDDTDVACMSSVKSMTPDIEIPGTGNVLNMLMNPLVNDERPTMMNTVKKKVSLQEYLKRTKETKKPAAAGGAGSAAPSAAHTNTTSSSPSLPCSTDSVNPKPTTVANNDSSSSSSAVTTTITTTTTNRHNGADKTSESNNTNDTSSSISSSPAAASGASNTDIPVNSKESCDDVPMKNNNSRASVTSQVVPVVKGSNNINSDVSSTPPSRSTLNDSSLASSPSSTSSTLSSTTKSAIITTNSNSVRTKPITTAAVAPTAAVNSTSTASNNMSNPSKVSACDEESLNADKVLALIKNSCEGLNAQSLTELTNAITSEDIYKNVPPEITSLITQAIKTMKENNGGRQPSAAKPRGGSCSTTTTSLAAAKSSLHKTVTAPGKMQSLSSPTRHPSPRQSRSHSLMSGSPSIASSRPLTESSRHSSVDSLKDAAEGGKHRRISGTSTTSNHSNHPLSPAFKERTFHSVSQHKTANNSSKASESPGHSSSKTSASPITSGQPIPSLVSRRPDNTAARVPQVVYGRRESPLTSGSPAALWDAFGSPSSQDQFYRSISSPRSRQQSPSSRSSRPVSPRSRGGNHSPAYRSSSPSSSDRSSYRRTSTDWQSPRSYSRDESSRGSKYPSQSSSKFATPGRSVSPQRTTDGNNGGHHYCQAPSRGGSDRSGSPGGGPMRSSSSSRDASNYYYSKHSSSSSYNDQHPYNRSSSGSSSSKYYQPSSSSDSSSYRDRR